MDIKQIQELVKLINKTNIGEITIEEDGTKITIKQKKEPSQKIYMSGGSGEGVTWAAPQQPVQATQAQTAPATADSTSSSTSTQTPPAATSSNHITIKSPMIGTFYRQPGPDKPPFVNVGDEVAPGKVVCMIEAMKLFNEIESEVKGKIIKVLVDDATPVEYDQPLFLVDPS